MARLLAAGLGVLVVVAGVLSVAISSRGIGGTVSHVWHSFTTTRSATNYDPGRRLSADSQNRWVWWKEAAGAFSDRPLGGWGAGSFPVTHLLYRRNTLSVSSPTASRSSGSPRRGLSAPCWRSRHLCCCCAAGVRRTVRRWVLAAKACSGRHDGAASRMRSRAL